MYPGQQSTRKDNQRKPQIPGTLTARCAEVVEPIQEVKPHIVKSGDTVWKFVENDLRIKGLLEDKNPKETATAVANFIKKNLNPLNAEQLEKIGIKSGEIGKINIGQKIDLSRFFK